MKKILQVALAWCLISFAIGVYQMRYGYHPIPILAIAVLGVIWTRWRLKQ